jgi:hypothetical protein
MGIYGERTRRSLHKDGKGLTGTKIYVADWTDIEDTYHADLPVYGEAWSATYPYLRCIDISSEEIGAGVGEVVCQYSTERQFGEEFCEVSLDYELETTDETKGWEWETVGTPVEQHIPLSRPRIYLTLRMRCPGLASRQAVVDAQDTLNAYEFFGFPRGFLRFHGASTDESYDESGNMISAMTVFKFEAKPYDQNYKWREVLRDRSATGAVLYYQDKDATIADTYTVDDTLIGTAVPVSGTAGTAGWDLPKDGDGNYIHSYSDFSLVLGLPFS